MADDATRALICLITGESSLFKVRPTGRDDIMDLKELIKEEGKNGVLNSVDAKDLVLWKVRMTLASDNTTNSPAG
jgi:Crinkler effector protein N-terminal domain